MMLRNFLYRVQQYAKDNQARLWRLFFYIIVAAAIIFLIVTAVEHIQKSRYEKKVQALDLQIRDAEQKAKDAEARALIIRDAIETKNAEIDRLGRQAIAMDAKLRNTGQRVVTLKEQYETVRYVPIPNTPVSCADVCAQLAELGYKCQ